MASKEDDNISVDEGISSGLEQIVDNDEPTPPVATIASMYETTKGVGEHNRSNVRRSAGLLIYPQVIM